jgi:hypothetical protein
MAIATLTHHARHRCRTRGIPESAVDAAIDFGRHFYSRGADHYIIGWREVRFWADYSVDLEPYRGVHVICASGGQVLTTYRKRRPNRLGGKRSRLQRHAA